jgi:hypothetical protein
MMARIDRIGPALAAVLLCLPALSADGSPKGAPAGDEDRPRLYTNADLERFGPPSSAPPTLPPLDPGGWPFVQEFLERERAKLQEERAHELTRETLAIERERSAEADRTRRDYRYYGWPPWTVFPRIPDPKPSPQQPKVPAVQRKFDPRFEGERPTLHSRPSAFDRPFGRFTDLKGEDVVPSNARRGAAGKDGSP